MNTGFTFKESSWWYWNWKVAELRGKGSRDDLNQNFYIEKIDEQNFYMKTHNGTYLCLEISSHLIRSNIITPDDLTPDYTCVLNAYQYNQRPGRVAFNFAIHGDFFFNWFIQLRGNKGSFRYDKKFYVVWKPVEGKSIIKFKYYCLIMFFFSLRLALWQIWIEKVWTKLASTYWHRIGQIQTFLAFTDLFMFFNWWTID